MTGAAFMKASAKPRNELPDSLLQEMDNISALVWPTALTPYSPWLAPPLRNWCLQGFYLLVSSLSQL
jgi:hypothetical protein